MRGEIRAAIATLETEGLSIFVVDKSLEDLAAIAYRRVILEKGATCWTGASADPTPAVADRFLGV